MLCLFIFRFIRPLSKEEFMESRKPTSLTDMKIHLKFKLSALWVSVMFCYVYGDYFNMYKPKKLDAMAAGNIGVGPATDGTLLGVSIMMAIPIKLAALWTVVMLSIVMADIIGFIHPGTLQRIIDGNFGFPVTPELLLLFSVLTAIPIVMIFLSLILPVKTIPWVSTLAVVLTTLFVVGGGSATYSYVFFATLEIVSMVAVLWYVWKQLGKSVNNQSAHTLKNSMP
jgi:Family of unknown function (DUF6326)